MPLYVMRLFPIYENVHHIAAYGTAIPLQGKPTNQSSTHGPTYGFTGTSDKAVDGDTNGDYFHAFCTHTSNTEIGNPWWVVDIEETYCVDRVVIYNRVDCCGDRLDGAIIRVGSNSVHTNNPECASRVSSTEDTRVIEIECNLSGQYLSVELPQNGLLTLCEVEAYTGYNCTEYPAHSRYNNHLQDNNLIETYPSAYKASHSTETALIRVKMTF
ncbi:fucolectin-like [Amphiura filiformis]|uniref:fucolectin-like n=1 Tax=Amphiura filiformis TaxID=82378 RepID=UPI003B20D427